jgi:glucokinase
MAFASWLEQGECHETQFPLSEEAQEGDAKEKSCFANLMLSVCGHAFANSVLSLAARGGDSVCGKLVNEIVGLAESHR